ncbi:MAG: HypC/HybG/HupF family hydrogenase formation chaperone [Candidatus Omnitrophota bacterium]
MCLAYPMKITGIKDGLAHVAVGDIKSTVSVELIEDVKKGDYVLVHAGIAIEKIDQFRADEILTLITELGRKMDSK